MKFAPRNPSWDLEKPKGLRAGLQSRCAVRSKQPRASSSLWLWHAQAWSVGVEIFWASRKTCAAQRAAAVWDPGSTAGLWLFSELLPCLSCPLAFPCCRANVKNLVSWPLFLQQLCPENWADQGFIALGAGGTQRRRQPSPWRTCCWKTKQVYCALTVRFPFYLPRSCMTRSLPGIHFSNTEVILWEQSTWVSPTILKCLYT